MRNSLKAALSMILSQFFIIIVQFLTKLIPLVVAQQMAYRGIMIVLIHYFWMKFKKQTLKFYHDKYMLIACLALLAFANQLMFIAIRRIPLAIANILFQTSIIWTQFFAAIIYGKALSFLRMRNIFISLFGILLIIQPPFLFGKSQSFDISFCFLSLFASILESICTLVMSEQSSHVDKFVQIHYFQFSHAIVGSLQLIYFEQSSQDFYRIDQLFSMLIISVLTYLANLYYFQALSLERAERIAPANSLKPIFALIFDLIIFNQLPDWISLVGSGIILISTISTIIDNLHQN